MTAPLEPDNPADPTAIAFDPTAIAFDDDARAEAEAAADRGESARRALLDAANLVASIAVATIGHSKDQETDDNADSPFIAPLPATPSKPTAQQLAAEALRRRFGTR